MNFPELVSDELAVARSVFSNRYQTIEQTALKKIRLGKTVDNPYLLGKKDPRYSMTVLVLLDGWLDEFLRQAALNLKASELDIRLLPDGFRHIALRDIAFNAAGRLSAGVRAGEAKAYYTALTKIPAGDPIRLELYKIFPALDTEQDSVSVVAAFFPVNLRIMDIRTDIKRSVEDMGLPVSSRLGSIPVIFSTIGRLPHPPKRENGNIPVLEEIAKLNEWIPQPNEWSTGVLDIVSTTHISYKFIDKHVYLDPTISITHPNEPVEPAFITARQKI